MNKNMCNMFMFLAGAAVGSIGTWLAVKGTYAKIAQEEIDSVKEVFSRRNSDSDKAQDSEDEDKDESTIKKYEKMVSAYTTTTENSTESGKKDADKYTPCVIPPEEFGEDDEYDIISLIYYADGVLADEEEIVDIDEVVGLESLKAFGEYDDDAVHVRNDETCSYYEILRDTQTYQEATGYNQHCVKLEE